MADAEDLVRVELARVIIQERGEQQFLYLREQDGGRTFPIVVGFNEAAEIHRKVVGQRVDRPLTHDLLGRVLDQLGWTLESVAVTDLRDATFFATLMLRHENGEGDGAAREVDCRPSDAICLAVQKQAPIFVKRKVLDAVATAE